MVGRIRVLLLITVIFFSVIFPGSAALAASKTLIKGAGATFPYPLYAKWFNEYSMLNQGVRFSYQPIGSGEGIAAILEHKVDFAASDKLLSQEEAKRASGKIIEIPMVLGAVAVAYNLPGSKGELKLTPDLLAAIFLREIKRWNDPRIAAVNKNFSPLPDQTITIVHRADPSGTTSIFTDYLSQVSSEWAHRIGKGTLVKWPAGVGEHGNGGVAQRLKSIPGSIGYIELSYAHGLGLPFAAVRNREGYYVEPNPASIEGAARQLRIENVTDQETSLVNKLGRNVYPICSLTWIMVYAQLRDHQKGEALVKFLKWSLGNGQQFAMDLHYVRLPEDLRQRALQLVARIRY
ncbi:MAG TPA: phosphate ABC transporter substrate-binding protein PstS [Geobacteraceae bacterium]|nr:phosphate ABC transporter substrate-binding protein PstS [Geobacteraceae bacterium]